MVFKLHFVLTFFANSYILSGKVLKTLKKKTDTTQELNFTVVPLGSSMLISAMYPLQKRFLEFTSGKFLQNWFC